MKCKECGEQNAPGAKFCNNCGSTLEGTDFEKDNDGKTAEIPTEKGDSQLRKNNLLIIVLSTVAVLVAAIIIALLVSSNKNSISGKWYNPTLEQILEFRNRNELVVYNSSGGRIGTYTYNSRNSNGTIILGGISNKFESAEGSITVHDQSGIAYVYLKVDDKFNVDSMMQLKESSSETANTTPPADEPTPTEIAQQATPTPTPTPEVMTPTPTPFIVTPNPATPTPTPTPTPTIVIVTPTPTIFIQVSLMPIPLYTFSPINEIVGTWESLFTTDDSSYTFFDTYQYRWSSGGSISIVKFGTYTYDYATKTGVLTDTNLNTKSFEYNESTDMIYVNGVEPYVRQP